MNGHWYIGLRNQEGATVEVAVPCQLMGTIEAIETLEAACPGWTHPLGATTWRPSFDLRRLNSNGQPDYQRTP